MHFAKVSIDNDVLPRRCLSSSAHSDHRRNAKTAGKNRGVTGRTTLLGHDR